MKNSPNIVVTDTAMIDGVLLELVDNAGAAQLRINSDHYKKAGKIMVGAPCNFMKDAGKTLFYSYPETGIDKTVLIKGKSGLQGLIFKDDSIFYRDFLISPAIYDDNTGLDEKMYWDFAHGRHKKN